MTDTSPPNAAPADTGWHRYSTAVATGAAQPAVAVYGDGLPTEADLRLLGDVDGSRILDLGCGTGHNAVVFAEQGAKVIGVDPSTASLAAARDRAEAAEVRVELHQAELADLAFLRSDTVDGAISVMALATVDDLARVFRQVHRVLKPEASLICSFPHPAFAMFDPSAPDPLRVTRSYDDTQDRVWHLGAEDVVDKPRTVSEIFTTLHRASFGIDQILEPTADATRRGPAQPELMAHVPATLLVRARKRGN